MVTDSSHPTPSQRHVLEYDETRFPLVLVRSRGRATDAELDALLAALKRPLLRREKYVEIFDGTHADPGTPSQRRTLAEWMRAHANLINTYSIGTAIVMPSPLVRGALTAIFWIQPLPCPHTVVSTMAEAERWAEERLRAAGLAVPPKQAWTTRLD